MGVLANPEALWAEVYFKATVVPCCEPGSLPTFSPCSFPDLLIVIFSTELHTTLD